jgi:hypothetical protein
MYTPQIYPTACLNPIRYISKNTPPPLAARLPCRQKVVSAPRIELGTFRLQSNITVERDTVQIRILHD